MVFFKDNDFFLLCNYLKQVNISVWILFKRGWWLFLDEKPQKVFYYAKFL